MRAVLATYTKEELEAIKAAQEKKAEEKGLPRPPK